MTEHVALYTLGLCAGIGMLDEGIRAGCEFLGIGHRTVCYVEREAYAAAILAARMEEGSLAPAPVWSDLATFDGRAWCGIVDCIIAGLPCQPYSLAGKRLGHADKRSYGDGDGPLVHALRIIDEVRPAMVFLENVPAWVMGGWFRRFGEALSELDYTIEAPFFLAAENVGASHRRERVFILAHARNSGPVGDAGSICREARQSDRISETESEGGRRFDESVEAMGIADGSRSPSAGLFAPGPDHSDWRTILAEHPELASALEFDFRMLVDGVSMVVDTARAHQLRAVGNGVVPLQAAVAFIELARRAGIAQG